MFAQFKCCFGNEISMLEQTFNKLLPPCVQNNMNAICPTVDAEVYCTFGALGSIGTSPALLLMNFSRAEGLPNMYSENEVFNFRSIITQPLMLSPLTAMVTSFVYYNDGTPIVGSDITNATSAEFNILITQQWSTNASWANIVTQMGTAGYGSYIATGYAVDASAVNVSLQNSVFYSATPMQIKNAAVTVGPSAIMMAVMTLGVLVMQLLM